MVAEESEADQELLASGLRRLMQEILRGTTRRTVFHPWEIDLLLDLENCAIPPRRRPALLRQYLKMALRRLESGPGPPLKVSEYLQLRKTRRPSNR